MKNKSGFLKKLVLPIERQWRMFFVAVAALSVVTVFSFFRHLSYTGYWYLCFLSLTTSCFVGYVSALVVWKSGSRWLKGLLYGVWVLVFIVELFLRWQFLCDFSPAVLRLLFETNAEECGGFLFTYALSLPMLYVALSLVWLLGVPFLLPQMRFFATLPVRFAKAKNRLLGLCLTLSVLGLFSIVWTFSFLPLSSFNAISKWEHEMKLDVYDNAAWLVGFSLHSLSVLGKETDKAHLMTVRVFQTHCSTEEDSLNVVLVIGESHIRSHSAIYGYPLMTTPEALALQKSGNLFAFQDVMTTKNLTTETILNMLSTNSVPQEPWYEGAFVPAVMRRAGFDALFWDNQKESSRDKFFTLGLNAFLYNDETLRRVWKSVNEKPFDFDTELVDDFLKRNPHRGKRQFVVFHLWGQHFAAEDRYPKESRYMRFSKSDYKYRKEPFLNDRKREEISHYDNATLYNDHILGRIFSIFKDENTVAVYLSDHGEEIYDWRDGQGRSQSESKDMPKFMRSQISIPLYVYVSDKYKERHKPMVSALRQAAQKPFTSGDLGHLIFSLAFVHAPFFDPTRSPVSPAFRERHRFLLTGEDCDALLGQ